MISARAMRIAFRAASFVAEMRISSRFFIALLSALTFFLPATLSQAQEAKSQPQQSVPAGVKVLRDVPYVTGGHARQKLDLFLPENGTDRPLVVWIHGGAWEAGSKENCPARGMVARGYAVASINYRLSQHAIFPAQIEDCKSAIRWLRAHAAEYGINPQRIGVWGASAGGHLVAMLGTTGHTREFDKGENLDQSSRVQCVLDWFGPADFLHWGERDTARPADQESPVSRLLGGKLPERESAARAASPVYFVQKDAPPFLIMHGDKDSVVPIQQSEVLVDALKKAGIETSFEIITGGGHGGPGFSSPDRVKLMTSFFDRHIGDSRVAATKDPEVKVTR